MLQDRFTPHCLLAFTRWVALSAVLAHNAAAETRQDAPTTGHGSPQVIGPIHNNESSIVRLPDGALKIFHIDDEKEHACFSIVSTDDGIHWGEPQLEFRVTEEGSYNTASLLDQYEELLLFYLVGRGIGRSPGTDRFYDVWVRRTVENRTKWTEPKRVYAGYVGSIRSVIQLSDGQIVLPLGVRFGRPTKPPYGATEIVVLHSDDGGDNWQLSSPGLIAPVRKWGYGNGAIEPSIIHLNNNLLWILIRTDSGRLYQSFSPDGVNWSPAGLSRFASSESPSNLLRLSDGRIILLWNNSMDAPVVGPDAQAHYSGRDALHAAISEDEGVTWRGFREVYRDPLRNEPPPGRGEGDRGTAYPRSVETSEGYVVLVTGQGERRRKIVRFHPDWLYEVEQEEDFSEGLGRWHVFRSVGLVDHVWKNRVAGAELVDHPDTPGKQALHLKKRDEDIPDGAVRNFPNGRTGRLDLRLKFPPNAGGAEIALLDRLVEPGASYETSARIFSYPISAGERAAESDADIPGDSWHRLSLEWDLERATCCVSVDDDLVGETVMQRPTKNGVSYLSLRSLAPTTAEVGFFVEGVTVHITEPMTTAIKLEPRRK